MWTTLVCELNLISVSGRPIKNHKGVSYHGHITIRNAYSDDVNKVQMKVLEQIVHIEGRSAIYIILMYQGARKHLRALVTEKLSLPILCSPSAQDASKPAQTQISPHRLKTSSLSPQLRGIGPSRKLR